MAFTIVTYWNTSDNNYVNKNITQVASIQGTLRNETEVVDPTIIMEVDHPNKFNYLYIQEFARYYYVRSIRSLRNNLIEVSAHCDVLMTYKAQLLELECVINRNTHDYNVYLPDDQFSALGYERVQCKEFPNALTAHKNFVLACAD